MVALFVVLQVLVALFLILVVLLQPGNKGGMSAAFGGAGGETVFGGRGANSFLAKLTFAAAAVFMITSFVLSFLSMPPKSVVAKALQNQPAQTAPGQPAPNSPAAPSGQAAPAGQAAPLPAPATPEKK